MERIRDYLEIRNLQATGKNLKNPYLGPITCFIEGKIYVYLLRLSLQGVN